MQYFLDLFGNVTVSQVVAFCLAATFLYSCYKSVEKYFKERASIELNKEKQFQDMLKKVEQYSDWHQQTLDIQKQFSESIAELKVGQDAHQKKLEEIEEENKRRERNKLRDRLVQSHRYYTDAEKNPMQKWSEMEADAFWQMFGDYETAGGDGYIHTVVEPDMRKMETVPMHETEQLAEMMRNRK